MTNALFFIRRYALQMHLQTAYVRILTDISDHLEQLVTISCVRLSRVLQNFLKSAKNRFQLMGKETYFSRFFNSNGSGIQDGEIFTVFGPIIVCN